MRNHHRKQKRRGEQGTAETGATVILDIPVPAFPAAVIHWYRETKDAPLHALGAELWMGNDRVAKIESVHCLGLMELQVKTVLLRILDGFSQHVSMKVERFRSSVELHPQNCLIYKINISSHSMMIHIYSRKITEMGKDKTLILISISNVFIS